MNNNPKFGRAAAAPIVMLDEFVFDANSDSLHEAIAFGRTTTPLNHLEPFEWDVSLNELIHQTKLFTERVSRLIECDSSQAGTQTSDLAKQILAQVMNFEQRLNQFAKL